MLNEIAVNADFTHKDQIRALIARQSELLGLMEASDDIDWVNDVRNELRVARRVVATEITKKEKTLKAASANLQRDFSISHD